MHPVIRVVETGTPAERNILYSVDDAQYSPQQSKTSDRPIALRAALKFQCTVHYRPYGIERFRSFKKQRRDRREFNSAKS